MITYCKACGSEINLKRPTSTDYKFKAEYYKKRRRARKGDLDNKNLIFDYNKEYVIGYYIPKMGIPSWHAKCDCGKMVYHTTENSIFLSGAQFGNYMHISNDISSLTKVAESNSTNYKTLKLVSAVLKRLGYHPLFVIGVHWYNFDFSKVNRRNIKDVRDND